MASSFWKFTHWLSKLFDYQHLYLLTKSRPRPTLFAGVISNPMPMGHFKKYAIMPNFIIPGYTDWVFLGIPVQNCGVGKLLTWPITYIYCLASSWVLKVQGCTVWEKCDVTCISRFPVAICDISHCTENSRLPVKVWLFRFSGGKFTATPFTRRVV